VLAATPTCSSTSFEDFYVYVYAARRPPAGHGDRLLVISADGKGIVMRPDALRAGSATRAARASLSPRPGWPAASSNTANGWPKSARSTTPPRAAHHSRHPRPR
jgi:hypothetical protein